MLTILELFVKTSNYEYLMMDGTTSVGARQNLVKKFNEVHIAKDEILYSEMRTNLQIAFDLLSFTKNVYNEKLHFLFRAMLCFCKNWNFSVKILKYSSKKTSFTS